MIQRTLNRFVHKRIGKNIILAGQDVEALESTLTQLHFEMKKMEKRETMYVEPRLLEKMHKGEENKKYWRDTIRHHDQKKISFFVTNILATKKISVPIR